MLRAVLQQCAEIWGMLTQELLLKAPVSFLSIDEVDIDHATVSDIAASQLVRMHESVD